jgi:hypothetical protein
MMKKALFGAVVAGVVIGLFLAVTYKQDEIPSPLKVDRDNVLAGLVTCLSTDTCQLKRAVEKVEGQEFVDVYYKVPGKNISIKYMMEKGKPALTVVIIIDAENHLTVSDLKLSGFADVVAATEKGQTTVYGPISPGHLEDYETAQRLYELALQTAWDQVVPANMRKHLEENPDVQKFRS